MQAEALPVLFNTVSPAVAHNRHSDTVEWTHFSTLTTTLPPGPWLWTVTPIHWSSLLSDEGSAVEKAAQFTQSYDFKATATGNEPIYEQKCKKQLLNCLDCKSKHLVNLITQSRKITSHLKKMGEWLLVWMIHQILYIKYIPLPGSPSLSLTSRVPSTETTIQTNKRWVFLYILPNLLHNSMNSSLLQMGRQGLRLTLYLPINAEKESDIFIFTSFLQKGERGKP